MRHLVAATVACLLVLPSLAWSDTPSPSDGVPVSDPSISTQSDATSLEVNPAGLGYLRGFEAGYGFFLPTDHRQGPSGHSLNFGLGSSLGGFGAGVQWMDNPRLGPDRNNFRKFTLGSSLSPTRFISVGASYNFFSSRTDERLNDLRTADVGLQWRPTSAVGVGLTARDIRPAFLDEDRALPLRLGAGVALRGFDGRLVYETEVRHVRGADHFDIRPRLATEPLSGLRFFGQGIVNLPMPDSDVTPQLDGLSVGLELSTGTFGAQGAGHFGEQQGAELDAVTGTSYRLWASSSPQQRALFTPTQRWVHLEVDESIAEQASFPLFGASTTAFFDLINDLDAIAEDPSIAGVVLEVGNHELGPAQLWELSEAIDRLRGADKESVAVVTSEAPTTEIIYAASAADEVWMEPSSPYGPTGINFEFTSFANLLDRMGIEAEFMRIGEYKSAPESFVLPDAPSEPALEQTSEYLDALYDEMTRRIADRRDVDVDEVRQVIDESPLYPAEAMERDLVDAVVYADELDDLLRTRLQSPLGIQRGYQRHEIADRRWGGRPEIAVVYVDGMMIAGESGASPLGGDTVTGAETLTRTLRQLRNDNNVKAVVLRIDSPGGSAVAGDRIYRSLRQLAMEKPVIASMGNAAASGGYYAAAGADEIFATPVTLTGSIGVYAGKFNVAGLADRFGVTSQQEQRGDRAGLFSPWRPWTDSEREAVAETIEYIYQLFLQQASRTRPLSPEELDEVARGRVWTGEAAQREQLTDHVGGISDAIRRAEELADLETGEALYRDRSGAGVTALSPGMATGVSGILERLGIQPQSDTAIPDGQISQFIEELESSLLWPLYFDAGEAVFLPPAQLTY